jgi:hypothetical protein|tara:strand:- start:10 stop:543 length:534 start_codon:yes stop_codon:yes gene_type:complete
MGGFGGGADSSGSTGRERGATRSRTQSSSRSKSKSKSTKSNDTQIASPLINTLQGLAKMAKTGQQKNKDVKANNALVGFSDFQGDVKKANFGSDGDDGQNKYQGIEFAKASTGSATILGPGQIQKEAANNVKGPTTTEMTADQISLSNNRKGRRSTNITAKKTLAKNYTLSKKSLLG